MSREFKLKLIQKSLDELGYGSFSKSIEELEFQQKDNAGLGKNAPSTDDKKYELLIEWIFKKLKEKEYETVVSYINSQQKFDDSKMSIDLPPEECRAFEALDFQTVLDLKENIKPVFCKLYVTVILYLIRKYHFIDMAYLVTYQHTGLIEDGKVNGDLLKYKEKSTSQPSLIDFVRNEIYPLLDEIEYLRRQIDDQALKNSVPFPCLNLIQSLAKPSESKVLILLLLATSVQASKMGEYLEFKNYLTEKVLSSKHHCNSIFEMVAYSLHDQLSVLFKNSKGSSTDTDLDDEIQPNCMDTIIDFACRYQRQLSPYYLPPRLKVENEKFITPIQNDVNDRYKNEFPSHNLLTLKNHSDEVWIAKFSPSGTFLVTGSLDGTLVIYDVLNDFNVLATLEPDNMGIRNTIKSNRAIIYCCWDPNEDYLVSCCLDTVVRIWRVSDICKNRKVLSRNEQSSLLVTSFTPGENIRTWTCEFLPPNLSNMYNPQFVIGSPDKVLKAYDINGVELFDFYGDTETDDCNTSIESRGEGPKEGSADKLSLDNDGKKSSESLHSRFNRVGDLTITPDGKYLITANDNKQVYFYTIPDFLDADSTTRKVATINLGGKLVSCSTSLNGKYLLLSITPDELQIWDISPLHYHERPFLKRKFYGHRQGKFVVRSSFGYVSEDDEQLVLSGSLDGYVYIWKIESGQLVTRVKGHDGLLCSSVDWNRYYVPKRGQRDYGCLWCSVGDDKLVKIWGPPDWYSK